MGGRKGGEEGKREREEIGRVLFVQERSLIDVFEEGVCCAATSGHRSPPLPHLGESVLQAPEGIFSPWGPRIGDTGTCSGD